MATARKIMTGVIAMRATGAGTWIYLWPGCTYVQGSKWMESSYRAADGTLRFYNNIGGGRIPTFRIMFERMPETAYNQLLGLLVTNKGTIGSAPSAMDIGIVQADGSTLNIGGTWAFVQNTLEPTKVYAPRRQLIGYNGSVMLERTTRV